MEFIPIEKVLLMQDGQDVMAVSGTVHKVYGRNTGTSGQGPWSVQRLVLMDNGSQIKAEFWDRPEIPAAIQGSQLLAVCTQNLKRKWTGVAVIHSKQEGKPGVEVRLKIRTSAKVTVDGVALSGGPVEPAGESGQQQGDDEAEANMGLAPQQPAATPATPPAARPAATAAPAARTAAPAAHPPTTPHTPTPDELKKYAVGVSKQIGRMGNAYKICMARASAIAAWEIAINRSGPWEKAELVALATTFFIQGNKDGTFAKLPDSVDVATLLPSLDPNHD